MKIQYCSDLHLEFQENKNFLKKHPIEPIGEILLMAGDILPIRLHNEPNDFIDYVADNFEAVYWIPGNHEYYHYDLGRRYSSLFEEIRSNVFLVNNETIKHKDITLVCSTLWSNIKPQNEWLISENVNDFDLIKKNGEKLTPKDFNLMHTVDLNCVKAGMLYNKKENIVVLTHYVPTRYKYPNQYKNSDLNDAFSVELYDLIFQSGIPYWIYGHHHINTPAFKIGKTTMLTNQLGYVKQDEHQLFNPVAIIEI